MTPDTWIAVDRYLSGLLSPADEVLEATQASADAAGLPAISVSSNLGKLLFLLAQIQGARRILEVGTLAGYSTIWLARALPSQGKLITLEADEQHAEVARANLGRAGLNGVVELRLGLAGETLQELVADGAEPFDLIFLDADKAGLPEYLAWSLKLTRPGGLIVADNVVRKGAVIDPADPDPDVQGVRRFLEAVAAEPRLCATALQMVGVKGYDGIAIARVVEVS